MSARQSLADALSTVPGVAGHTSQPAAPSPGQAWPVWTGTEYTGTRCGPVPDASEWDVVLVLPALDPAAGDALRDLVAGALGAAGHVASAAPDTLEMAVDAAQPVPIIRYALTINERKP